MAKVGKIGYLMQGRKKANKQARKQTNTRVEGNDTNKMKANLKQLGALMDA